jgi:hypothetical protein
MRQRQMQAQFVLGLCRLGSPEPLAVVVVLAPAPAPAESAGWTKLELFLGFAVLVQKWRVVRQSKSAGSRISKRVLGKECSHFSHCIVSAVVSEFKSEAKISYQIACSIAVVQIGDSLILKIADCRARELSEQVDTQLVQPDPVIAIIEENENDLSWRDLSTRAANELATD